MNTLNQSIQHYIYNSKCVLFTYFTVHLFSSLLIKKNFGKSETLGFTFENVYMLQVTYAGCC